MSKFHEFVEIPVLDDAVAFSGLQRGSITIESLRRIGVDVRGQRVIDLGAGFGSLSLSASAAGAASVISVDIHKDRLDQITARAEASGFNVGTKQANLLSPLDGGEQADLALMFGVVEYAGLWSDDGTPDDLQRRVFKTAYAALRPGGQFVVGTKNRAWPKFLLRDVHTNQPLVNSIPRRLADILSLRKFGSQYRHHIHTPRRWANLVEEAGFSSVKVFIPYFSYQLPFLIVDRPRLRDLKTLKSQQGSEFYRTGRGRAGNAKARMMVAGSALHIPLSQSVVIIAVK